MNTPTTIDIPDFVPLPPTPPASFGELGAEFALALPVPEAAPVVELKLETEPAEAPQKVEKFVPVRRVDRAHEGASPQSAPPPASLPHRGRAVTPPANPAHPSAPHQDSLQVSAMPYATPPSEPPRSAVTPSEPWSLTPLADGAVDVEALWDDYLAARARYRRLAVEQHDVFVDAAAGEFIAEHGGIELYEWTLFIEGQVVDVAGLHARCKRGPAVTPVVLELTLASGTVRRFEYSESMREPAKDIAAAIRKRGKLATRHDSDAYRRRFSAELFDELAAEHAIYASAFNRYSEATGQDESAPDLNIIVARVPTYSNLFAAQVVGSELRPPLNRFDAWFSSMSTVEKLFFLSFVFFCVAVVVRIAAAA